MKFDQKIYYDLNERDARHKSKKSENKIHQNKEKC